VPGAVVTSGETVSVEAPPALTTDGLRVAARPPGDDVTLRLIRSAVPVTSAVPTLLVPLVPWTTVSTVGLAEIKKSEAAAVTSTVTETLCWLEPSTPVIVTV
jgi:hypothetical protein